MNWMTNLVVMLQIVTALVMIGLVLVQHGKGADMGASFGSGASGSLFGATGSANFLSRSTAVCAAIFFACTLLLAYISNERMMRPGQGTGTGSILERPATAASAPPATGAAQIPGAAEVPPPATVTPAPAVPTPAPATAPAVASEPAK
ncbi:preprotein translocase subunit SecG [Piscinibacter sakaiensis]|uniref:preprotein translocase subunit SecG n=1 Tax=Piscinibacter sakaiensis TaxID=1547922 RepID=UPI003AAAF50F